MIYLVSTSKYFNSRTKHLRTYTAVRTITWHSTRTRMLLIKMPGHADPSLRNTCSTQLPIAPYTVTLTQGMYVYTTLSNHLIYKLKIFAFYSTIFRTNSENKGEYFWQRCSFAFNNENCITIQMNSSNVLKILSCN